jgi:hypothetical protein
MALGRSAVLVLMAFSFWTNQWLMQQFRAHTVLALIGNDGRRLAVR